MTYNSKSQTIISETSRQESKHLITPDSQLRAGQGRERLCCLLATQIAFSADTVQGPVHGMALSIIRVNPPTSINNQDSPSQTCPQAHSDLDNSLLI